MTRRSKQALLWTGVGLLVLTAVFLWFLPPSRQQVERVDFDVYWGAVRSMLDGGDLYGFSIFSGGQVLPFVYPPFAALLMVPAALTGIERSAALWVLLQIPATVLLAWLVVRNRPAAREQSWVGQVSRGLLVWLGLVFSHAVSFGIGLGQVSLMLVAVVVLDLVVVPPRWRGFLTGLAAAVKLTPAAFVLYLLATRQWRAAIQAVLGFLAATAISWLILPAQSWQYWTQIIVQSDRIGTISWLRNKSLLGFLAHWDLGGDWQRPLWLAGCLVLAALGAYRAARLLRRGDRFGSVILFGLVPCVVSPITWGHHLVWLVLAGLCLALADQVWARWLGVLLVLACSLISPLWISDFEPALWLQVAASLPLLLSVLLICLGLPGQSSVRTGEAAE